MVANECHLNCLFSLGLLVLFGIGEPKVVYGEQLKRMAQWNSNLSLTN